MSGNPENGQEGARQSLPTQNSSEVHAVGHRFRVFGDETRVFLAGWIMVGQFWHTGIATTIEKI